MEAMQVSCKFQDDDGEGLVVDKKGHTAKLKKGKGRSCQNLRLWADCFRL